MIYLDYSANHPVRKEVLDAFVETESKFYGNANSLHEAGMASEKEYERLNDHIYELLGLNPDEYEIIYTSSATESNNLAIKGVFESYSGFGKKILSSEFEHNSVNATLSYLKNKGADVQLVDTDENGLMSITDLENKLSNDTILVTLTAIESETGTIQDYEKIQEAINRFPNAKLLLDATQAIGKIKMNLNGIDMVSFAPHKFGGIIGTGVLIKKKNIILTPLFHGGKSQSLYRSSTLALGLLSSIEKSLSLAINELNQHYGYVFKLHEKLFCYLQSEKKILINSKGDFPYIINFSISDKKGGDTVKYLSEHGICISQKSACSLTNTPSKPVMAIFHDKKRALASVRVSLSYMTTEEEIDILIDNLKEYIA